MRNETVDGVLYFITVIVVLSLLRGCGGDGEEPAYDGRGVIGYITPH